jgi:hypothetical protein
MRTHLNVTRDLATDPWPVVEHFLRSPELWLPLPARAVAGDHHVVTVRLGPVLHAVRATVGDPWTLTDTISRRLAWVPCDTGGTPVHTSALPCFDGRIRIHHGDGVVTASLMGSDQPPGGPLGAAMDRALLHRSGDATGRAFLEDVVVRLQTPIDEEAPR